MLAHKQTDPASVLFRSPAPRGSWSFAIHTIPPRSPRITSGKTPIADSDNLLCGVYSVQSLIRTLRVILLYIYEYSATRFRQHLYQVLDQVLATGCPAWIERNGKLLKILPEQPENKLDRLEPHDVISGDPEELVHMDWSKYWRGKKLS